MIGWFRFGRLGESVDFDPNENWRVIRAVGFSDSTELFRFDVRVSKSSIKSKSSPLSRSSFGISVMVAPIVDGCVSKFGNGGCVNRSWALDVFGMTVTSDTIFVVVVGISELGSIRASDGLFVIAEIDKKKTKTLHMLCDLKRPKELS